MQGRWSSKAIKLYLGCPNENLRNILCPYQSFPLYDSAYWMHREYIIRRNRFSKTKDPCRSYGVYQ